MRTGWIAFAVLLAACATAGSSDPPDGGSAEDALGADGTHVPDGGAPPADAPRPTGTFAFQNGVSPTPSYTGATDTFLNEADPNRPNGDHDFVIIDGAGPGAFGTKDLHGLFRWELSGIPAGAVVGKVTVIVTSIQNTDDQTYDIVAMRRSWSEGEATWKLSKTGAPWQTGGARGDMDRDDAVLGRLAVPWLIPEPEDRRHEIVLGAEAIELVQGWIDDPATNQGLMLIGDDNANALDLKSSETTDPVQRPRLVIELAP